MSGGIIFILLIPLLLATTKGNYLTSNYDFSVVLFQLVSLRPDSTTAKIGWLHMGDSFELSHAFPFHSE